MLETVTVVGVALARSNVAVSMLVGVPVEGVQVEVLPQSPLVTLNVYAVDSGLTSRSRSSETVVKL